VFRKKVTIRSRGGGKAFSFSPPASLEARRARRFFRKKKVSRGGAKAQRKGLKERGVLKDFAIDGHGLKCVIIFSVLVNY